MSRAAIKKALSERSAKVWIDEAQRTKDGEALHVSRWAENESEPNNPRLWRWTPRATLIEVKSAWLVGGTAEWVPENKRDRSLQIHRWGYS